MLRYIRINGKDHSEVAVANLSAVEESWIRIVHGNGEGRR